MNAKRLSYALVATLFVAGALIASRRPFQGDIVGFTPGTVAKAEEVNANFDNHEGRLRNAEIRLDDNAAQAGDLTARVDDIEAMLAEIRVPAGTVVAFAGTTIPEGWVLCDGSDHDSNDPQFVRLFNAIGTTYGTFGLNFRLPDYRGRFLRAVDHGAMRDPDVLSRQSLDPTMPDARDRVGTIQGTATGRPIGTSFTTGTAGGHGHPVSAAGSHSHTVGAGGTFNIFGLLTVDANPLNAVGATGVPTTSSGDHTHSVGNAGDHTHSITGGGDAETRPTNIYVDYIIKL